MLIMMAMDAKVASSRLVRSAGRRQMAPTTCGASASRAASLGAVPSAGLTRGSPTNMRPESR